MQRFDAGPGTWKAITAAIRGSTGRRRAAIAFVTPAGQSLLPLRRGDELVVNASEPSLRSHATDPSALQAWTEKGVKAWSHGQLHAKVIVADDIAIVGSANASLSASSRLAEAVLITDSRTVIKEVNRFIDQLQRVADQVDHDFLERALRLYTTSSPRFQVPGASGNAPAQTLLGEPPWTIRVAEATQAASAAAERAFEHERQSFSRSSRGFSLSYYETERETASKWAPGELLVMLWWDGDQGLLTAPAQILEVVRVPRTSRCIAVFRQDPQLNDLTVDEVNERLADADARRIHSPRTIRSQQAAGALLGCWDLP